MWVKNYTVKEGDSWASISGSLYGNQRYFAMLASYNGGKGLKPGMIIEVPDLTGAQPGVGAQKPGVPPGALSYYGPGKLGSQVKSPNFPMGENLADNQATWKPPPGMNTPTMGEMAKLPPGRSASPFEPGQVQRTPANRLPPRTTPQRSTPVPPQADFVPPQFRGALSGPGGGVSTPVPGAGGMSGIPVQSVNAINPTTGELYQLVSNASIAQTPPQASEEFDFMEYYNSLLNIPERDDARFESILRINERDAQILQIASNPLTPLGWMYWMNQIFKFRYTQGDINRILNQATVYAGGKGANPESRYEASMERAESYQKERDQLALENRLREQWMAMQDPLGLDELGLTHTDYVGQNAETSGYFANSLAGHDYTAADQLYRWLIMPRTSADKGTPLPDSYAGMPGIDPIREAGLWVARAFTWGSTWISKFWERAMLLPAWLGYDQLSSNMWTDLIMSSGGWGPMVKNPENGTWGWWRLGGSMASPGFSGWKFVTPSQLDEWRSKQMDPLAVNFAMDNLNPEGVRDLTYDIRRWEFDKMIRTPSGGINWGFLLGTTNNLTFKTGESRGMQANPNSLLANTGEAMWLAGGGSGMVASFWIPEDGEIRWQNLIKLAEEGASLVQIEDSGLVVDPWSEFTFNFVTDPTLLLGMIGGPVADAINFIQFPPGKYLAEAVGSVANRVLRANISTIETLYQKAINENNGILKFMFGITNESFAIQYSERIHDIVAYMAMRAADIGFVEGDDAVTFWQRILNLESGMLENLLPEAQLKQMKDAIENLVRQVGSSDIQAILKKYGIYENIGDMNLVTQIIVPTLRGAQDPDVVGRYVARAIVSQFRKEMGLTRKAASVSSILHFAGRLLKEDWLMLNPKYIVGNLWSNFAGTIVSGFAPTFDLNYWQKASLRLTERWGIKIPENVVQSYLGSELAGLDGATDIMLANEMIPIPFIGTPRGIAHFIYRFTGRKLPQGVYEFMTGQSGFIRFMDRFSWGGLMREWQDFSSSVEKSARAKIFVQGAENWLKGDQGLGRFVIYLNGGPDMLGNLPTPGRRPPGSFFPGLVDEIANGRITTWEQMFDYMDNAVNSTYHSRWGGNVPSGWAPGTPSYPPTPAGPPPAGSAPIPTASAIIPVSGSRVPFWSSLAPNDLPDSEISNMLRGELENIHISFLSHEIDEATALGKIDAVFTRASDAALEAWDIELRNINMRAISPAEHLYKWMGENDLGGQIPEVRAWMEKLDAEEAREASIDQYRAQDPKLATAQELADGVPPTISENMTQDLIKLGWDEGTIRNLSVADAWDIIKNKQQYVPRPGRPDLAEMGRQQGISFPIKPEDIQIAGNPHQDEFEEWLAVEWEQGPSGYVPKGNHWHGYAVVERTKTELYATFLQKNYPDEWQSGMPGRKIGPNMPEWEASVLSKHPEIPDPAGDKWHDWLINLTPGQLADMDDDAIALIKRLSYGEGAFHFDDILSDLTKEDPEHFSKLTEMAYPSYTPEGIPTRGLYIPPGDKDGGLWYGHRWDWGIESMRTKLVENGGVSGMLFDDGNWINGDMSSQELYDVRDAIHGEVDMGEGVEEAGYDADFRGDIPYLLNVWNKKSGTGKGYKALQEFIGRVGEGNKFIATDTTDAGKHMMDKAVSDGFIKQVSGPEGLARNTTWEVVKTRAEEEGYDVFDHVQLIVDIEFDEADPSKIIVYAYSGVVTGTLPPEELNVFLTTHFQDICDEIGQPIDVHIGETEDGLPVQKLQKTPDGKWDQINPPEVWHFDPDGVKDINRKMSLKDVEDATIGMGMDEIQGWFIERYGQGAWEELASKKAVSIDDIREEALRQETEVLYEQEGITTQPDWTYIDRLTHGLGPEMIDEIRQYMDGIPVDLPQEVMWLIADRLHWMDGQDMIGTIDGYRDDFVQFATNLLKKGKPLNEVLQYLEDHIKVVIKVGSSDGGGALGLNVEPEVEARLQRMHKNAIFGPFGDIDGSEIAHRIDSIDDVIDLSRSYLGKWPDMYAMLDEFGVDPNKPQDLIGFALVIGSDYINFHDPKTGLIAYKQFLERATGIKLEGTFNQTGTVRKSAIKRFISGMSTEDALTITRSLRGTLQGDSEISNDILDRIVLLIENDDDLINAAQVLRWLQHEPGYAALTENAINAMYPEGPSMSYEDDMAFATWLQHNDLSIEWDFGEDIDDRIMAVMDMKYENLPPSVQVAVANFAEDHLGYIFDRDKNEFYELLDGGESASEISSNEVIQHFLGWAVTKDRSLFKPSVRIWLSQVASYSKMLFGERFAGTMNPPIAVEDINKLFGAPSKAVIEPVDPEDYWGYGQEAFDALGMDNFLDSFGITLAPERTGTFADSLRDFWLDFETTAVAYYSPSVRQAQMDAGIKFTTMRDELMRMFSEYTDVFADAPHELQLLVDAAFDPITTDLEVDAMIREYFWQVLGRKMEDVSGAVNTFYNTQNFNLWKFIQREVAVPGQPDFENLPMTQLRPPEITSTHKRYIQKTLREKLAYDQLVLEQNKDAGLGMGNDVISQIFSEMELIRELQIFPEGPRQVQVIYNYLTGSPRYMGNYAPSGVDIFQAVRGAVTTLLGKETTEVLMRNWVISFVVPDVLTKWKQLMTYGYVSNSTIRVQGTIQRAWIGDVYIKVGDYIPTPRGSMGITRDAMDWNGDSPYYLIYKPFGMYSEGVEWFGGSNIDEIWEGLLTPETWKKIKDDGLYGSVVNPRAGSPGQYNLLRIYKKPTGGFVVGIKGKHLDLNIAKSLLHHGFPPGTIYVDISDPSMPDGQFLGVLSDFGSVIDFAPIEISVNMQGATGVTKIDLSYIYEFLKADGAARFGYHPATRNIVLGQKFDVPHEAGDPSMAERFAPLDEWLTVKKSDDGVFSVSVGKGSSFDKVRYEGRMVRYRWTTTELDHEGAVSRFCRMLNAIGLGDAVVVDMDRNIRGTAASMLRRHPVIHLLHNIKGTLDYLVLNYNAGTLSIDSMNDVQFVDFMYEVFKMARTGDREMTLEDMVTTRWIDKIDVNAKSFADLPKTPKEFYEIVRVYSRGKAFLESMRHLIHSELEHGDKHEILKLSWRPDEGWAFDTNAHPGANIDATAVGPKHIAIVRGGVDNEENTIIAIRQLYEEWGLPEDFVITRWDLEDQTTKTVAGWLGMPETVTAPVSPQINIQYRIIDPRMGADRKFGSMSFNDLLTFRSYVDGSPRSRGYLIGFTTPGNETLFTFDATSGGDHTALRRALNVGIGEAGQWSWDGSLFMGAADTEDHLRVICEQIFTMLGRDKKYAQVPIHFGIMSNGGVPVVGNLGDYVNIPVNPPYRHTATMQEIFNRGTADWKQSEIQRSTTDMTTLMDSMYRWNNNIRGDIGVPPVNAVKPREAFQPEGTAPGAPPLTPLEPLAPTPTNTSTLDAKIAARQQSTEDYVALRKEYYALKKRKIGKASGGLIYGDWLMKKLGAMVNPVNEEIPPTMQPPAPPAPPQPPTVGGPTSEFFNNEDARKMAEEVMKEIHKMWNEMLHDASMFGIGEVNRILHDYHAMGNIEGLLRGFAPFTTWQLRNPIFWAQVFMKKPNLLAWALRYFVTAEQSNDQRNLTNRFNKMVGTNIPEGNVVPAGYYATDPTVALPVFQQFRPPFEAPGSLQPTDNKFINFMRKVLQYGRTVGVAPYPWFSLPMEYMGLLPKGTTQLSLGPIQRIAELALQATHRLEPGEGLFGKNYNSDYLYKYYGKVEVAFMEAEGLISHEEALRALMDENDPNRQAAMDRVLKRNLLLGTYGNVSYLPVKYASPGEMIIRSIKGGMERSERGKEEPIAATVEAYQAQRLDDWLYTQFPYLETYSLAMGDDQQKLYLAEIFFRYEEAMAGFHPWDPTYKDLISQRSLELEKVYGPQEDPSVAMEEYLRNPIQVGDPRGLSEYELSTQAGQQIYDEPAARLEVLSRLRSVEPRAEQFMDEQGKIDWQRWDDSFGAFMDGISNISGAFGYEVSLDDYLSYRYRRNNVEEVGYAMYKMWKSQQWERYEQISTDMQPGTNFYHMLVHTAAEAQYLNDLTAGFTPYEADILRAENLLRWETDKLDYEWYEKFRQMYSDPIFAQTPYLNTFASRVADIMGIDKTDSNAMSDINRQLAYEMPGISKPDPVRDMRTTLNTYLYDQLTPIEVRQVKEYFGIEKIPEDDAEMAKMYYKLLGAFDVQTAMGGEVLVYQEHPGIPVPPLDAYLTPEEIAELNQFKVESFRYFAAREAGVGGTWTPLMDKYMPDGPQTDFWGALVGISLSDTAYNDPVLNGFLNRASRSALEYSDEQWVAALKYLKDNWDLFYDAEGTQLIKDNPGFYETAMTQREEYDRFKDLDMEVLKAQYYSIPSSKYDPTRRIWERDNPEKYTKLKDYMQRELTRAFQYPYFMYFFKKYDYGRYFGSTPPDIVDTTYQLKTISDDFQAGIDDMNAFIEGSGVWTDAMMTFFGPPPPGYSPPKARTPEPR